MIVTKTRIWVCRTVAVAAIGATAALFYMVIDREPPYEYIEGSVHPDNPRAGDQISIHWHIKVKRFCPGWVDRFIVDGDDYVWRNTGGPVRSNLRHDSHIVNTVELPKTISPGLARYRAHVCYQCNPLHRVWPLCVAPPDIPFRIVPK